MKPTIKKTAAKKGIKTVLSENKPKATKKNAVATKREVTAAGKKVMKKYNSALKNLANR